MTDILTRLRLTPEIIARHVVSIAPAATRSEIKFSGNPAYYAQKQRERRQRLKAMGLNTRGNKPKRRARPELAGLTGDEYARAYNKLWRNERANQNGGN